MDFQNGSNGNGESSNLAEATPIFNGASNVKRVIADPAKENVLVLPAGVNLDDIDVVGDNLVITLPDGTQMVVINGAIYVPEIVIDGVTVPPMNLAALLNDDQPEPAAGNARSSGGNFADPVGPIQPAYAIGDLLPYTELFFPEQTDEEVYFLPDRVPTAVSANNPGVLIDDDEIDGIPGGPGDDIDPQNTTGQLDGSGGDGELTFTFNGDDTLPEGFDIVTADNGDLLIRQDGEVVTVVHLNPDGTYVITQVGVIDHPANSGNFENNVEFVIGYTVTDEDGDTATATFTITVDDDSPVVTPVAIDSALLVDETDLATDDSADFSGAFDIDYGADSDGTTTWSFAVTNGANSGLVDTATGSVILLYSVGGGTVEGRVGGATGAVVFTVAVDNAGVVTLDQSRAIVHGDTTSNDEATSIANNVLGLQVTVVDGDGDTVQQVLDLGGRLTFEDDGPSLTGTAPTAVAATAVLDESPLAEDGDYADDFNIAANFAGVFDYGTDGPGSTAIDYALALNGSNVASGLYLLDASAPNGQGAEIVLNLDAATGVITGSAGGTNVFTISIDDAGTVTFAYVDGIDPANIWHADTTSNDDSQGIDLADGTITAIATATDGDGDSVSASVDLSNNVFRIEDDGPSLTGTAPTAVAATAVLDESPLAEDGDYADDFNIAANFAGVFDYGTDGPGSTAIDYALALNGSNVASGLYLLDASAPNGQGAEIVLNLDAATGVITGSAGGTNVFTISIDDAGTVTFAYVDGIDPANIWHADTTSNDDSQGIDLADGTITAIATATDGDGDSVSASVDLSNNVFRIEDDGPSLTGTAPTAVAATAVLDESPLAEDGDYADDFNIAANFAGVFDYGTDGPGSTAIDYALALNGSNVASGLYLLDASAPNGQGAEIVLNLDPATGVITGSAGGTNVFTISIDDAGTVTFAYVDGVDPANIWHADTTSNDDSQGIDLADGTITAIATATDGDGDSVAASVDLSNNVFRIEDDGPSLTGTAPTAVAATAVLDESPLAEDGDYADDFNIAANFAGVFDYGTDGPGSTAIDYALALNGSNVASGLYLLDASAPNGQGAEIVLNLDAATGVITGSAGGTNVFTISIDDAGTVTFAYVDGVNPANIWHADTTSNDDSQGIDLADGTITAIATATDGDGDGDSVTASVDLSNNVFRIEDDGPSLTGTAPTAVAATAVLDESPLAEDGDYADDFNIAANFAGVFDYGTDGPGSTAIDYALALNGSNVASGLYLLDASAPNGQGAEIVLNLDAATGVITGSAGGTNVFTISIDDAGTVTFAYVDGIDPANIWHADTTSNDDSQGIDLADGTITAIATATDGDGDSVSASVDLSNNVFRIEDDGPSLTGTAPTAVAATAVLDESPLAEDGDYADDFNIAANFAGVFDYGTDGPGSTAIDYALALNGSNVASGLYLLDASAPNGQGAEIVLNLDPATGVITGSAGGTNVFTISIDDAGTVTFAYVDGVDPANIWHADTTSNDDSQGIDLADGTITAIATATDGDGDSVAASVDLSNNVFRIEDDGPSLTGTAPTAVAATAVLDESPLAEDGDYADDFNIAANFAGVFDYGTDGPGSTAIDYALALNGSNVASGLYLLDASAPNGQGAEIVLNLDPATGVITGSAGGTNVFTISIDDAGTVTFAYVDGVDPANIWHADTTSNDDSQGIDLADGTITAIATATDGDGDSVAASVDLSNNVFRIEDDGPSLTGTAPTAVAATAVLDESPLAEDGDYADDFNIAANFAGVFDYGTDGPGSTAIDYALALNGSNVASGLYLLDASAPNGQGAEIVLNLDAATGVITGSAGGTNVFTISIDDAGTVTFAYVDGVNPANIWHADTTSNDDSQGIDLADGTITAIATATDGDGDSVAASVDLSNNVFRIEDDGPSLTGTAPTAVAATAVLDESPLAEDGDYADDFNIAANFAGVFDYGTDGPGSTAIDYALALNGSNVASGLYLLDASAPNGQGAEIVLNLDAATGVITGSAGGTNVFTISIDDAGTVTFAYVDGVNPANIWHADTTSNDDSQGIDLADGTITAIATATDGDGDSVAASVDLSNNVFRIEDDGPSLTGTAPTAVAATAVLDESPLAEDGDYADDFNIAANFAGVFDYGTDGPGSTAIDYALALNGSNVASGLYLLDASAPNGQGAEIVLNLDAATGVITGSAGGTNVFTISIDDAGTVTFAYVDGVNPANIWHADTTSNDDSQGIDLADGTITAIATATDGDGDSVAASVDLSNNVFRIEDDGPSLTRGSSETYVVEDELPGGNSDNDGDTTTDTGTLASLVDFGTDGAGGFRIDLSADSLPTTLTSNGQPIVWYASADGTTLVGATGGNIDSGHVITVTITDKATGAYTVVLNDQIDHDPLVQPNSDAQTGVIPIGSAIVAYDADGDTVRLSGGSVVVRIEDDLPIANADTDYIVGGGYGPATGNVLTGVDSVRPEVTPDGNSTDGTADQPGADMPAKVVSVSFTDPADPTDVTTVAVPAVGSVEIDGAYGTLTFFADGTYSYTRDAGTPGNVEDVFQYTIRDADGDTATTTLTIEIGNEGVTATIPTAAANTWVYETALDNAHLGTNEEMTAGVDSDTRQQVSGVITFTAPDGLGSIAIAGTTLTGPYPQTVSSDATGTLVITSAPVYDPDTGNGTISYTYTLINNVLEPTSQDTQVSFLVQVTDTDGDTNTAPSPDAGDYLVIKIIDDDPLANPDTDTVAEGGAATGNVLVGDQAGEYDFLGADETTTVTGVAKGTNTASPVTGGVATALDTNLADGITGAYIQGDYGVLQVLADGSYRYTATANNITADAVDRFVYTITDGDGSTSTTTLTINVNDVTLIATDNEAIVYEAGLPEGTQGPDAALVTDSDGQITVTDGGVPVTGLTFTLITPADGTYGTLTLNPDGSYTYVLDTRYVHGADNSVVGESFTYEATDANGNSTTGTIAVTIVDDEPTVTVRGNPLPLVLDESPDGQDEGGDFTPAGVSSTTLTFGALFAIDYGADLQGTATYSLALSGQNIGSGLYALDPSDTTTSDGDGIGQGAQILLSSDGGDVVGKVGTTEYFRISVDATGKVTFTQSENIYHANPASDDDVATLTTALGTDLKLTVSITDSEGDPASASINLGNGVFQIEDDGPAITTPPADSTFVDTTTLGYELTATGALVLNPGTDGYLGGSPATGISFDLLSGTVAGNSIFNISDPVYDPVDGRYEFSFQYTDDDGATQTANGTITTNGTSYTVNLDSNFEFSSVSDFSDAIDRDGYDFTNGGKPQVVTIQLDSPDPLFVQFTGFNQTGGGSGVPFGTSVGASQAFNGGSSDLFTAAKTYLNIGNAEYGVADDTLQPGEVLDFDLFNADPMGDLSKPSSAYAEGITLTLGKLNPNGGGEDLVVVLKLADPDNPGTIIETRAIIVGSEDIYRSGSVIPGYTNPIAAGDGQSGFVVIEANDYRLPGDTTEYVIVGAQLLTSTQAVSGSGIALNGTVGDSGGSSTFQQFGTTDTATTDSTSDQDVIKIVDVGLIRSVTNSQAVSLDFGVTVTDADGDKQTDTFTINPATATPPVVLDLNGNDTIDLLSHEAGVTYDYGSGAMLTAWVGTGDGILAFDANRPDAAGADYVARIDGASEFVFGHDGMTDLEALAADYDTNGDLVLNVEDAGWSQFGVWIDAGVIGTFEDGEFHSLADLGITSISLSGDGISTIAADGDAILYQTTTFTQTVDGVETTGIAGDVGFMTVAANDDDLQQPVRQAEAALLAAVAPSLLVAASHDATPLFADPGMVNFVPTDIAFATAVEAITPAHVELPHTVDMNMGSQMREAHVPDAKVHGDDGDNHAPAFAASDDASSIAAADLGTSSTAAASFDHAAVPTPGPEVGAMVLDALLNLGAPVAEPEGEAKGTAALEAVRMALNEVTGRDAISDLVDHLVDKAPESAQHAPVDISDMHALLNSGVAAQHMHAPAMPDAADDAAQLAAAAA